VHFTATVKGDREPISFSLEEAIAEVFNFDTKLLVIVDCRNTKFRA